jgi:hypothetical protein
MDSSVKDKLKGDECVIAQTLSFQDIHMYWIITLCPTDMEDNVKSICVNKI